MGAEHEEEKPDYRTLVRQATASARYGIEPPKAVAEAAAKAMRTLEKNKEEVTAWIISSLQNDWPGPATHTPLWTNYGMVLWRFGPEYVCRLEPTILRSKNEALRIQGVHILAMDDKRHKEVDALVLAVLKRDSSYGVKAEAVLAMSRRRMADMHGVVTPYLASEQAVLRKAAIQYWWNYESKATRLALEKRLETEADPSVGFWLGWTLCKHEGFQAKSLLSHEQPGIRYGALFFLAPHPERASAETRAAILDRLRSEKDILCRFEIARFLANSRDVRCLPILVALLKGAEDPRQEYSGGSLKTSVAALLANVTDRHYYLTDPDRKRHRQGNAGLYDNVAEQYEAWWNKYSRRIRWVAGKRAFSAEQSQD